MTWSKIGDLIYDRYIDGLIDNVEKVASSKNYTQFDTIVLKPYQNGAPKSIPYL